MNNWRVFVHDFIEVGPLRWIFHSRHAWLAPLFVALLTAAIGLGLGWGIAEAGVLPLAALLLAAATFIWMLRDIETAYWAVIGLVTLLPFASLPFKIGFTPTFLDLALGALFFVWLLPYAIGQKSVDFITTPLDGPILAFIILAIGSFVFGLAHGALTSYLVRHFAEFLLSVLLFYLIVNTVRDVRRLERLLRVFLLAAGGAALLGIVLYVLPDELTIRLLSTLGRLGYPTGAGVLRFIRDDPALMQRATSTSVDPNVLGSLLNLSLVLGMPQLFAPRPLFKRVILIPLLGVIGLCLGLTISRGSIGGAAAAIGLIAALRYRKLLPLLLLVVILVLLLPWTQEFVVHSLEGLQGEDLSTKMRLGEYKDALILISRYPVLGVGFAAAPDIDIYIGVSNMYLLVAEQMGVLGLSALFVILGVWLYRVWRQRARVAALPHLEPLWYGLHGAVVGGLLGGLLDHYFFSLNFHHSMTIFWLFLGLAAAVIHLVDGTLMEEASA